MAGFPLQRTLRILGLVFALSAACLMATAASAAGITVNPTTVPVGGPATISGDVLAPGGQPGCALPGTVLLFSGAFGNLNVPVQTTAGSDAKFSVQITVPGGVVPGTYTVTGRCGGGDLGVQATIVVTGSRLPATGAGGLLNVAARGSVLSPAAFALLLTVAGLLLLAGAWSLRDHLSGSRRTSFLRRWS